MKLRCIFVSALLLCFLQPMSAFAAEKTVQVQLPEFPVTLNGTKIDNQNSQYPLLVYQDMTYFPMTYHGTRFLHLKANWYQNERYRVLFVGYCMDAEKAWVPYLRETENKVVQTAVIPEYSVALNTLKEQEFIENQTESYPFFNFRGITYIPLTWRFAVEEFGWEYHFDEKNGLVINAGESFQVELEDVDYFSSTMPIKSLVTKEYVYNADHTAYVGYPQTNLAGATFVYQKKGEKKKTFSAEIFCKDGEYYFNREVGKGTAQTQPVLEDGILTIQAIRMNHDGEEPVLLHIDCERGELVE